MFRITQFIVLANLTSTYSTSQCIVCHKWPSDKQFWQIGHPECPMTLCLGWGPPLCQDAVPGLLKGKRSYLVAGHVPIRATNRLSIENKQSLRDESGSTRSNESLYYRLYSVCIWNQYTTWLSGQVLACYTIGWAVKDNRWATWMVGSPEDKEVD